MIFHLLYRTAEEKEDWIQARITHMHTCSTAPTHPRAYAHTVSVSHAVFLACAFRSSASLENRISKDFLPTLIQCVWELYSLIKPLIIAHLAYYSRVKLIKTFCRLEERVGV